jgi:polysaccharide export outer membrane protein
MFVHTTLAFRAAACVALGLALGACTILPSQGPEATRIASKASASSGAFDNTGENPRVAYAFVPVTEPVLLAAARSGLGNRLAGRLSDRRGPSRLTIGAGDIVTFTIFEAAPGGLFTPPASAGARPGNFVELPPQAVGRDGAISIPYAGTINVVGRTPSEVERTIEGRLKNRAIEPQVILTIREQRALQASVLGEVNAAAKLTLNPQGERVLDLIARAGGPRFPAYETLVSVQRGGQRAQTSLATLVKEPSNNIYVQPGDSIFLTREQRYFVALGASGQNGLFNFDAERVTLSYAMGKAGGLLDERADPGAVFIYRLESRKLLHSLGIDTSNIPANGEMVPTIYAINLREPSGLFLTQAWTMQDKDVIFVANAVSVEITKFLQFLRVGINTVREAASARSNVID